MAFGASPGMHEGLVNGMLLTADWVVDHDNIQPDERMRAVRETTESVKVALLISGADKRRYGQLKLGLANNYLLWTDQYPDTLEKVVNLLSNYRAPPKLHQMRAQPRVDGVAFIQRTGCGCGRGRDGRCGRGGRGSTGGRGSADCTAAAVNENVSSGDAEPRTNSA